MNNYYNYQNYMEQAKQSGNFNINNQTVTKQNPNMNNMLEPNMRMQQNPILNMPSMPNMNNMQNPNMETPNNLNISQSNIGVPGPRDLFDPYQGLIRGNMFPTSYDPYKMANPYEIRPINEQAKLLTRYDSLSFAAHDLNLYLDTHPEDREMIERFEQYTKEAEKTLRQYENAYGPLFVNSEANMGYPWSWNQSPWPWENR